MSATSSFYVTGGTLRHDAPSYVERQADKDLYEGLLSGEFCYVLHARQMGKSSLMAHTTARLREAGVTVVNLDLTRLGQNLTVEQWYDGLLTHLGRQLDLEDELEEYWAAHERQSPLQRWLGALQAVVLPSVGNRDPSSVIRPPSEPSAPTPPLTNDGSRMTNDTARLVIAIDEIDAVRSLPFSTDEFFAAIRECYNRRTQDAAFARLAFCLLGVATPSDLIQDTRTTPFNIGRRIELTDFTEAEAALLSQGLGRDEPTASALLQRVLFWTSGHPYLTQRLCQAVAGDETVTDPAGVDRLCEALFLSPTAQERDDNLLFVRERLLQSEAGYLPEGEVQASLLDLYGQVRSGKRVRLDDTSPLVSLLRLSGITRVADGALQVRNRIYERVFDRHWITQHMPDAELRRQRAAYRRGLLRATAVSAAILAVVAGLAVTALTQARRANRQRHEADQQRQLAQAGQEALRRHLYGAEMKVAQQAWEEGGAGTARALLEAQRPSPGQEDLRGFDWRYLWRQCQGDQLFTFGGGHGEIDGTAFSPDGRTIASGETSGEDPAIRLWDAATKRALGSLYGHTGPINKLAFSPDGKLLASGADDDTIRLWDVAGRRAIWCQRAHASQVWGLCFSPDGRTLATAGQNGSVKLWDIIRRREIPSRMGHPSSVAMVAFSPDGKLLASGSLDSTIKIWSVAARREVGPPLRGHTGAIICVAFSPDGKLLASSADDSTLRLWDVATRREIGTLRGHRSQVPYVTFSPDGKMLASGGVDNTVKLWDLTTRQEIDTLHGHMAQIWCLAFSPDGKQLVSGSADGTVRLWSTAREATPVLRQNASIAAVGFLPDGRVLATGDMKGTVRLWDLERRRVISTLRGPDGEVRHLAISPDGKRLASASHRSSSRRSSEVRVWDVASGRTLATFSGGLDLVHLPRAAFSPDGSLLAVGTGGKTVQVWDIADPHRRPRLLTTLSGEKGAALGMAFSPDGTLLATGFAGERVKLWRLGRPGNPPTLAARLPDPPHGDLWVSPDGKLLALETPGGIALWDVTAQRYGPFLREPIGIGGNIAFSPDGLTIATPSANTVRLWSLATQQDTITLQGHTGPVNAVAFSPDGSTLASASEDGTVRLWRAPSFRATDPLRLVLSSDGRAATLQWRRLPHALGYQVYRMAGSSVGSPLRKLTLQPVDEDTFTDPDPRVASGRPRTYAVAAVYREPDGQEREGPRAYARSVPIRVPPGWVGCSINEATTAGSVDYGGEGLITLRGAGADIWDTADACYFAGRPLAGDFTITVRWIAGPSGSDGFAKAGLMIRESLEETARNVALLGTPKNGLRFQWRTAPAGATDNRGVTDPGAPTLPLWMRISRRGSRLTAAYSSDGGRSFVPAGEPVTFAPPLPRTLYAGLAVSSHDATRVSEAKFSGLRIEPR